MKSKPAASLGLPYHEPRSRDGVSLDQALVRSAPLARLSERLRDSAARFAAVRAVLPEGLVSHITPGPVDDQGWSLLVANAAVAAKLRQLKPRIEDRLREGGWSVVEVRVKILPGTAQPAR